MIYKKEWHIGWLIVLFYGISTLFRSFNAELFQTIQFSISIVFVYKQLMLKQFS